MKCSVAVNFIANTLFWQAGSVTGHKSDRPWLCSTTNFVLIYAKTSDWDQHSVSVRTSVDRRYNQFIENGAAIEMNHQTVSEAGRGARSRRFRARKWMSDR